MENCIDKINLSGNDNKNEILVKQLRREILKFYNDTTKSLLCHDQKINELCKLVEDNLSSELRLLLDSMVESGEIEELIKKTLFAMVPLSIKDFGAVRRWCS